MLHLIYRITRQDLTDRHSGSTLGQLWLVLGPLVQVGIFTLVFGGLLSARLGVEASEYDYAMFLVAGILPWAAFSNSIVRITNIYTDKRAIISKVPVKLWVFPLCTALSEGIILLVTLVLVVLIEVAIGKLRLESLFMLPILVVGQQVLALALGSLGAVCAIMIRDMREVVSLGLQLWFWLTPIVYVPAIAPRILREAQAVNPAYWVVNSYQRVLFEGEPLDPVYFSLVLALGGLALLLAFAILRRLEKTIRDLL
jgi:lipopolysaccharide transport system permease protein